MGIKRIANIRIGEIRARVGVTNISETRRAARLRWLAYGHVERKQKRKMKCTVMNME